MRFNSVTKFLSNVECAHRCDIIIFSTHVDRLEYTASRAWLAFNCDFLTELSLVIFEGKNNSLNTYKWILDGSHDNVRNLKYST